MFVAIAMVLAVALSAVLPQASMLMPLATIVIFVAAPFVGVVSFRYGEPRALRRMLACAIKSGRVDGGVVLATSLARSSALVLAYSSAEQETLAQRISRSDSGVMGASRLIAVKAGEALELRTGTDADRLVAAIPPHRYLLESERGSAVLRVCAPDGTEVVSFPVIDATTTKLRPLGILDAQKALRIGPFGAR